MVIFYVLSGNNYIQEAIRSTESIKKYHPDTPCILCTPDKGSYPVFDDVLPLPQREHEHFYVDATKWWSIAASEIKTDKLMLLDCDTYALGPLDEYFSILDRFDFTGIHSTGRQTMVQRDDIPASFPELHIGANSFVRSKKVLDFLNAFYELYASKPDYFGNNDQGPLREALWKHPEIKLAVMPLEFCFRYRWGGLVTGRVRLLHGHEHGTPYEQVAKSVNRSLKPRVFKRRELA